MIEFKNKGMLYNCEDIFAIGITKKAIADTVANCGVNLRHSYITVNSIFNLLYNVICDSMIEGINIYNKHCETISGVRLNLSTDSVFSRKIVVINKSLFGTEAYLLNDFLVSRNINTLLTTENT